MEDLKDSAVLFVDDEADIVDLLQKQFRSTIGKIYTATDAATALEIVKQNELDIAVLDIKMPDKSGLTLFQELQQIRPSLHCIFLSAHGDKESLQAALRLGAENFVDKPFDVAFLKLAVVRGIEKARYDRLLREVLELFIFHYTQLDLSKFERLSLAEREKTVRAALGLAKVQILKKNRDKTNGSRE